MKRPVVTLDGNQAVASVAYRLNEVIAIYPITPSSPIGEWADQWYADGEPNIWGTTPLVVEMQSEGGAAGAIHGALQAGALSTTFTASQGLLLMIPNMYKIAGELTATVFHVASRSVAAQALSIFGDHSDVMATRATGFALIASGSVQEAMDMALICQAATLETRVPFLHFFDGFRTSHEVSSVEMLVDDDLRAMIDDELVRRHRERALSPDNPFIRGTAQNPETFFQARETVNPFYKACPDIVRKVMDKFYKVVGRKYELFQFEGASDAERIVILMGSGAEVAHEAVEKLVKNGEKVGVLKVRLYRPFSGKHLLESIPKTVKAIATLDRTKEPGSVGEPLYLDVVNALSEGMSSGDFPFEKMPKILGGRYGLSSKSFTPAMVKGVLDELKKDQPKNHFTVGITDDLTHTNVEYDRSFSTEDEDTCRAIFFGLGSDGTVGANKNSVKIIGEETGGYAQGYFVYDSKKAGAMTVSHLRFGPNQIRSSYLINEANFVACHQFNFLERINPLECIESKGTFLLNSPYGPDEVWDKLPKTIQKSIIDKNLKMYVVDGYKIARDTGMGPRINTILQTCFFAITEVIPKDDALKKIKDAIQKTYGKQGKKIVEMNFAAVDSAVANLHEVEIPAKVTSNFDLRPPVPDNAPEFVRDVLGAMIANHGDDIPVSALPNDGTYPSATTQYEKRNLSQEIPVWETDLCIQCGKCIFVCPHAVIREKVYDKALLKDSPKTFKHMEASWKEFPDMAYTIQVAVEDCTGCSLCVDACPKVDKENPNRKAINMTPQPPLRELERENWTFFLSLPDVDRTVITMNLKNSQLLRPLFEFSGACAGCGETPYVKLASQLFGDRMIVANATGCSSIYGGNMPTTPWAVDADGRGPAWSNSLFEDNAEFGLGMRLTLDKQREYAEELLRKLSGEIGEKVVKELIEADQSSELSIQKQRERIFDLKKKLEKMKSPDAMHLHSIADVLLNRSVWIMGGDGWAYDIGYGGLDHVIASGRNVNILILDTQVYSNTGGQASKATPRAAVAKFAASGKGLRKKDLGMMAMIYGSVYVAQVAMGAKDNQTLRAFLEAESYDGPSVIIAYSHCIEHKIVDSPNLERGLQQQKLAVETGFWPLYRFDPRLIAEGKNPLQLDSKNPDGKFEEYALNENRYRVLLKKDPGRAEELITYAIGDINSRWSMLEQMSKMDYSGSNGS
jgi:pyruvate-ferredoxin/flavodoxin oxidoreductase